MLSGSKTSQIRRRLLRWYGGSRRDLPWRRTHDPYAIWIAETMLQQTQVRTVLPYYHRFLKAFPNLQSLNRAPKERVLALWSGLGYYRRAENLKQAARVLTGKHGGRLPQDYAALLRLPGVGPYTAGALMSIAFQEPFPALDGNANRVLSRLLNLKTESTISKCAWELVPPSRPGYFNQALMELGSRICRPQNPNCRKCPLASLCIAQTSGRTPSRLHTKSHKANHVDWPMVIIAKNGRILLHRRSQRGLLRGLWEIPGGRRHGKEKVMATVNRNLVGLGIKQIQTLKIGEIRHSMTRYRIRSPLFVLSDFSSSRLPKSSWRWVSISSLHRYPLSSLSLKAIRVFSEQENFPRRI